MKPWINEDIFKTWTDAQKRLWDSLCSAVPFQPPAGVEAWRETYLKNLATWEAAVRQTLAQEASWVQQWVQRVAQEKGTPELMATWVRQMEEVLQRWVQTQNQWWDEYFAVLRSGGFAYPERGGAEPVQPAEPVEAVEPASAARGPTVVSPKPAVKVAEPAPAAPEAANEAAVEPVAVAHAAAALAEAQTAPAVAPAPDQPDDLKLIVGIGPALEKKLHAHGILSYRQLAVLGDEGIDRLETAIKAAGRIRRDDWIGQAKAQHFQKYGEQI
ncbi:MAG: hypothetical protein MZU84_05415 [Sphingobacterium sp.]|nr:hypothetical protein [Sphingobacterium sp.]